MNVKFKLKNGYKHIKNVYLDDKAKEILAKEGNSAQITWESFPNMGLSKVLTSDCF